MASMLSGSRHSIYSGWVNLDGAGSQYPGLGGVLNTVLVIAIIILSHIVHDMYSFSGLTGLLTLSVCGFIVDVVLIDHYNAI